MENLANHENDVAPVENTAWDEMGAEVPFNEGEAQAEVLPSEIIADETEVVTEAPKTEALDTSALMLGEEVPEMSSAWKFLNLEATEPEEKAQAEKIARDRKEEDRKGMEAELRTLYRATEEELPEHLVREVALLTDMLEDAAVQFEDEENEESMREILEGMAAKYKKLEEKTPLMDRKEKYFDMAKLAQKKSERFIDWKAVDEREKKRMEGGVTTGQAQKAFDELAGLM